MATPIKTPPPPTGFTLDPPPQQVKAESPMSAMEPPPGFTLDPTGSDISMRDVYPAAGADPSALPGSISKGALMLREINKAMHAKGTEGADIGSFVLGIGVPSILGQIPPFTALPEEGVTIPLMNWLFGKKWLSSGISSLVGAAGGQYAHGMVNPYVDNSWTAIKGAVTRTAIEDTAGAGTMKIGGAGLRALGRGGKSASSAIFNMLKKTVGFEPINKVKLPTGAAERVGQEFLDRGGNATEAQLSNSLWAQIKDTVARGGIGTKRMYRDFETAAQADAARIAREVVAQSDEEIAKTGTDLFSFTRRAYGVGANGELGPKLQEIENVTTKMYETVEADMSGKFANTVIQSGTKEVATGILDAQGQMIYKEIPINVTSKKIVGIGASTKTLKGLAREHMKEASEKGSAFVDPTANAMYKTILAEWPEEVPIKFLREIRTVLLGKHAQLAAETNPGAKTVRKLTAQIDDAIFNNAEYVGDDVMARVNIKKNLQQLRNVDQVYKAAMESYKETFAKTTVDKLNSEPEQIISIFGLDQLKPGAPGPLTRIQMFKDTLTRRPVGVAGKMTEFARDMEGELLWARTQKAATAGIIMKATSGNKLNGGYIKSYMADMGDEALMVLHGPNGKDALQKALDFSDLVSDEGENLGLIIHGAQAGAIIGAGAIGAGIAYGDDLDGKDVIGLTSAGLLILGPRALARSLLKKDTKVIVEQLAKGKMSFGAQKRLITKLIGRFTQEDLEEQKRMKSAVKAEERRRSIIPFSEKNLTPHI